MVAPQGLVRWDPDYRKVVPNLAKSWEISDGRAGIHLPPARGPALVGRRAVHDRGHHVLCRGHPAQSRLLQRCRAFAVHQRRQADDGGGQGRHHGHLHLRQAERPVPLRPGEPLRRAAGALGQALLQAVPSEVQHEHRRADERVQAEQLGRPLQFPLRPAREAVALVQSAAADARSLGDLRALFRLGDAGRDAAQPLFLAGRYRRQPAALHRHPQLPGAAERRGRDPGGDRRPDRHAELPPGRGAEPAGAVAEHREGPLQAVQHAVDRLLSGADLAEPEQSRSEDARDAEPEGLPQGAVAGDQPARDHRAGLRRPGRALPGRPAQGSSAVQRAAVDAIHPVRSGRGQPPARRAGLRQARFERPPARQGRQARCC